MDRDLLIQAVESLIFASDEAISIDRLAAIIEGAERAEIREAVASLASGYAERGGGIVIEEVAGGFRFRTAEECAPWLRRLFKVGAQRISKAAMEALSIIAYKQPATRGEVESIRGVDSGGVLATLMDKRFIKIVGRKEAPGRPVVYATTKEFLETFDLKDLSCLPTLKDIQRMEESDDEAEEEYGERVGEGAEGAEGGEDRRAEGGGQPGATEGGAVEEEHEDGAAEARAEDPDDLPEGPPGDAGPSGDASVVYPADDDEDDDDRDGASGESEGLEDPDRFEEDYDDIGVRAEEDRADEGDADGGGPEGPGTEASGPEAEEAGTEEDRD